MPLTHEQRIENGCKGGLARAAQPGFAEHQRHAGRACAAKHDMGTRGHRGAMATIARYGYGPFYAACRRYRLDHPSQLEKIVIEIMADLGLVATDYEREYEVKPFNSVDIAIPLMQKAIEINGRPHYDPLFDDPRYPGTRAANYADKLAEIERAGYQVLILDYREAARWAQQIAEFIL